MSSDTSVSVPDVPVPAPVEPPILPEPAIPEPAVPEPAIPEDAPAPAPTPAADAPRFSGIRLGYLALVLFLVAAILRVAGAWGDRAIADMDSSVVALMARHMAYGTGFPVFFYGQAYMGSLEPMASAACIRLFGDNGFSVALGPAIVSLLALFALWRWGKKALPATGALLALALAAVGPLGYWVFQFAPRGGYMVALLVDALVLSLAATLAARWWHDKRGGTWRAAILGVVAGIGLWTDPIVVPALLAAVILLLVGMRFRLRRHWQALVAGVAATLAGASPWIYFAIRHGGNFLALPPAARQPLRIALLSTWLRFLTFQGNVKPHALEVALAVVPLALAALGILAWLRHCRKLSAERNFAVAGALLFCAGFAAAFVFSGFNQANTGRYWIPFWPPLVVLAAWAPFIARTRLVRIPVALAIAALFATHLHFALLDISATCDRAPGELADQAAALAEVRGLGGDAVLAPRHRYPWNFAWHEEFCVTDAEVPFYEPIRLGAELAQNPVYATDWVGVPALFSRLGLEVERSPSGHFLVPRSRPSFGKALAYGLDVVFPREDPDPAVVVECPFPGDAPAPAALQFAFRGIHYQCNFPVIRGISFSVDLLVDGVWQSAIADAPLLPVFWSGTRAYLGDAALQYFPLHRPPRTPPPPAFRLSLKGAPARFPKALDWAFLAAPSPGAPADDPSPDALLAFVSCAYHQNPGTQVFAPRFLSNRLLGRGIPAAALPGLDSRLFPDHPVPPARPALPTNAPAIVLAEPAFAPLVRDALSSAGVPFDESPTVPHPPFRASPAVIFQLSPLSSPPPLFWNGLWLSPGSQSLQAPRILEF